MASLPRGAFQLLTDDEVVLLVPSTRRAPDCVCVSRELPKLYVSMPCAVFGSNCLRARSLL